MPQKHLLPESGAKYIQLVHSGPPLAHWSSLTHFDYILRLKVREKRQEALNALFSRVILI